MWEICGQTLREGEKRQLYLEPGTDKCRIPATFICGAGPGKTVVVTAGNHSDEYPGIAAVIRLAKKIDARQVKGNILFMHCVNGSGFWAKTRRVPSDGFNLNSDYPGKTGGSEGECIADYFVREIFPKADFVLDLHSGSPMEPLTPCLFFPGAERVRQQSLEAAKALDIPYLIESWNKSGQAGYGAHICGVPSLLIETGHGGLCEESWIGLQEKNICLLLRHLGIYTEPAADNTVCEKKVYTKAVYLEAEQPGLWYPSVRENDWVKKGQLLGRLEDFFGNALTEYRAEEDGTVFYYTAGLAVNEGDSLVAYGCCAEDNAG